jgi:hypothetical protein
MIKVTHDLQNPALAPFIPSTDYGSRFPAKKRGGRPSSAAVLFGHQSFGIMEQTHLEFIPTWMTQKGGSGDTLTDLSLG